MVLIVTILIIPHFSYMFPPPPVHLALSKDKANQIRANEIICKYQDLHNSNYY